MSLRVENVSIARGGVPILAGLSFALEPGCAMVLRGPNGSGKTSLLRTLAGLQQPVSGSIEGAGERLAYAAHADGLKASLSVAENLTFWARIFGKSDISGAIEAYDLGPLAHRLAGTLSAGQKRRLGLARLLVTGRPLWALDEPTVSLDRDAVGLFAETVKRHLASGGSALIATHIDLGIEGAEIDLSAYRAAPMDALGTSDEAFL